MFRTSRKAKRTTALTGGLLAAALVAAACSTTDTGSGGGGNTLDRVTEDKVVNVGFANERPYAYTDGDQLKGEAPAVHEYIFDQIGGIELEPKLFEFGALIQALNADRVDVVTAGMFITPERCQEASFSNP